MVFGTEVAMSIKEGRKAIGYDIEKKTATNIKRKGLSAKPYQPTTNDE